MRANPQHRPDSVRFRLFPKPPYSHPGRQPETVHVSSPAGSIGPGPNDDRMYVIRSAGKKLPYGSLKAHQDQVAVVLPPWRGAVFPPVVPNARGHFDEIPADAPDFQAAHVFGSVRFVLAVWEHHFGHRLEWHFSQYAPRLEINILPELNNAHAGYGFMEIGAYHHPGHAPLPYALNFDVIAHEAGHLVIYSVVGVPRQDSENGEYYGFHESSADMSALIAALHFDMHLSQLLEETHGNLYTFNELDRFAEISAQDQIRLASNSVTMWEFAKGWADEHALSQPLTGALFDAFIDIFQERLVESGVIAHKTAELTRAAGDRSQTAIIVQPVFDAAYRRRPAAFRTALIEARDYMGSLLAETWRRLSPDRLAYATIGDIMLELDRSLSGGRYGRALAESFLWRGIGAVRVGPRLSRGDTKGHSFSMRTFVPGLGPAVQDGAGWRRLGMRCACGGGSLRRAGHG